jgi:hypothetical protein
MLVPERRLSGVRHLDPLLVRRCVCDVAVVPVPPLVALRDDAPAVALLGIAMVQHGRFPERDPMSAKFGSG